MSYIITALGILLRIVEYLILARVILSWMPISNDNRLIDMLYQLTETILKPIRDLLAKSSFTQNTMLDFSPIVAFLIIMLIRNIIFAI